mmetsp:Transcript_49896/g.121765  ORF Transcript_49896/g.121765 Transcript_49896/m.121765 type:complete len:82 (+) Transcript_49896:513-758(+)
MHKLSDGDGLIPGGLIGSLQVEDPLFFAKQPKIIVVHISCKTSVKPLGPQAWECLPRCKLFQLQPIDDPNVVMFKEIFGFA